MRARVRVRVRLLFVVVCGGVGTKKNAGNINSPRFLNALNTPARAHIFPGKRWFLTALYGSAHGCGAREVDRLF